MGTIDAGVVVADAGPLIHLDELSALDVLSDYTAIYVPDAVWREVAHHRPQALRETGVIRRQSISVTASPEVTALASIYTLHRGEMDALDVCLTRSISTLLTDDTAARLAAKSLGIATHGTLGLLIRAARRGHRTPEEIVELLTSVPTRTTLHIRPSLLTDVIEQVRQAWEIG